MKNENVVVTDHSISFLTKNKTIWDAERSLYMRLSDHPDFIKGIAFIRKKLSIPHEGFKDGQTAFTWEHANRTNTTLLWNEAEKLVSQFTVPNAFRTSIKFFTNNFTLSPVLVEYQLPLPEHWYENHGTEIIGGVGRHRIGARLIPTGDNIEVNKYQLKTRAIYLEMTEETSKIDVGKAIAELKKLKKRRLPFSVSRPTAKVRMAWKLKIQKLSNSQIARELYNHYGVKLTAQQVPLYASRYKKSLQELKPFSS